MWGNCMDLKKRIIEYASIAGISTDEKGIAEYLVKELKKLNVDARIDAFGNVTGRIETNNKSAKTILLEAHLDQIGLMVLEVDENGYVKFVGLGGIDERILCGMEVKILSENPVYGIIGSFSKTANDGKSRINAKPEELRIDVGLTAKEAEAIIKPGDKILLESKPVELLNGRLSGAAMDNRAGVSAILYCAEKAQKHEIPYNIELLFSAQEELGLHGAFTGVNADISAAIVVDVTHGVTPDTKKETGVFNLGAGAVICRGPNLHYEYTKALVALAKKENIPYDIEVASGGSGTTAWAIQILGNGVPVMLVSIPLRYMHTNVETLETADVKAAAELIFSAISGGIKID